MLDKHLEHPDYLDEYSDSRERQMLELIEHLTRVVDDFKRTQLTEDDFYDTLKIAFNGGVERDYE
jgi:hypothetical protein